MAGTGPYVIAVWDEDGEENTHVIPQNWVQEQGNAKVIRWPPKSKVTLSFIKGCPNPSENWHSFKCKNIGSASDDYDVCGTHISHVETEGDCLEQKGHGTKKRVPNQKDILTEDERQVGILEEDDTMDFLQRSEMGEREEEGEREGSSQRMTPLSMTPTTDEKTKEKRQMAERERLAALSEGEFQWLVLMNLTQIKSKLDGLEGQMSGDADGRTGESQGTDDNGQPVKTPRELLPLHGLHTPKEEEELVQSVQDPENRQILVEILSKAARQKASEREVVYCVLKRLFDWSLSRHLNVRGTSKKKSIYEHPLFSVINDSVRVLKPEIRDADMRSHIINYLKNCGTNYARREGKRALQGETE